MSDREHTGGAHLVLGLAVLVVVGLGILVWRYLLKPIFKKD